ncbi:MAG: DNA methyltransferase [Kiloniellales bacterium]
MSNTLYFGDNLEVLRNEIGSESVDLIYLDPPFNSKATYNVLFRAPTGEQSKAQIQAFEDTWHWTEEAEKAFDEVINSGNIDAAEMLRAMRSFLKENDMMAYLTMMAVRLIELHRVLKNSGSIYLHCDPTASHYLKILMDGIFGNKQYRNEIVWDYSFRLMDLPKFYNRKHDIILFYAKSESNYFSMPKTVWTKEGLLASRKQKIHVDEDGVEWIWMPGGRGHSKNKLRRVDEIIEGGKAISDVWQIPIISSSSKERLSYPTQKPLILLERIIEASSKKGDVVFDPFCGCGTAVHAAQKLERNWIGIDITHLAISLIEKRLNDAFPDIEYDIYGTPKDLSGAKALAVADKYQFQWWAVSLINAVPYGGKKKGADSGIDGLLYFKSEAKKTEKAIVSVKGGKNVGVAMIRDLAHVVEREGAKIGVFITLTPPTAPMSKEAVKAGFYETEYGKYPRIQILTIEDLFAGKKPNTPLVDPGVFRQAEKEDATWQEDLPL